MKNKLTQIMQETFEELGLSWEPVNSDPLIQQLLDGKQKENFPYRVYKKNLIEGMLGKGTQRVVIQNKEKFIHTLQMKSVFDQYPEWAIDFLELGYVSIGLLKMRPAENLDYLVDQIEKTQKNNRNQNRIEENVWKEYRLKRTFAKEEADQVLRQNLSFLNPLVEKIFCNPIFQEKIKRMQTEVVRSFDEWEENQ